MSQIATTPGTTVHGGLFARHDSGAKVADDTKKLHNPFSPSSAPAFGFSFDSVPFNASKTSGHKDIPREEAHKKTDASAIGHVHEGGSSITQYNAPSLFGGVPLFGAQVQAHTTLPSPSSVVANCSPSPKKRVLSVRPEPDSPKRLHTEAKYSKSTDELTTEDGSMSIIRQLAERQGAASFNVESEVLDVSHLSIFMMRIR